MKYRGKRKDNGEVVYGYYFVSLTGRHYIKSYYKGEGKITHPPETSQLNRTVEHCIIPESLAMSTTVKDKNGDMIFGSIPVDGKMSEGGDRVRYNYHVSEPSINFYGEVIYAIRILKSGDGETKHVGFILRKKEKDGEIWFTSFPDIEDIEIIQKENKR